MEQTSAKAPDFLFAGVASDQAPAGLVTATAPRASPEIKQIQRGVDQGRVVIIRYGGVPLTVVLALLGTLLIHALLVAGYFLLPLLFAHMPSVWGAADKGDSLRGTGGARGAVIVEGTGGAGAGSRFSGVASPVKPVEMHPEILLTAQPPVATPDAVTLLQSSLTEAAPAIGATPLGAPRVSSKVASGTAAPTGAAVASASGSRRGAGISGAGRGSGRVDLGGIGDGDDDGPTIPLTKEEAAGGLDRGGGGGSRTLEVKAWGRFYDVPMRFYKENQVSTEFNVTISPRGDVVRASVKKTCGAAELDEIRLDTIRGTTFRPRIVNGVAVEATDTITLGGPP